MDVQSAAAQLVSYLGSNPDKISQFAQHPYSTTAKVTGTDETISKKDMSRILTQVAAQSNGQALDAGDTKNLASALMGQSGGSVHSLANALFGGAASTTPSGAPSTAEILAKTAAGAVAARGMAALLTSAMGTNKPSTPSSTGTGAQGVDLSSLAKIAEGLLGKK